MTIGNVVAGTLLVGAAYWFVYLRPRARCVRHGRSARRKAFGAALCAFIALSWGCAGPVKGLYPPVEGEPVKSVYVVSHGWHTGIVVNRRDIPEGVWPEHHDFPDSEHLEVGWGDRDFYQAAEPTSGLALKAAFWPTSSVLHIMAFRGPVEGFLRGSESIKIRLSAQGFQELGAFIQGAYARDEAGRTIPLGPGQYGTSRFYLAGGKYFLLRTCNNWIARALRAAGCPVTPFYAVTAGNVMYQARKCGAGTRPESSPGDLR